jgi:3-methyladenine DNA glycosylase AlkD
MTELQERLFAMQDESYRDFQCKLMPTVAREAVIGVRTPRLRALAKNLRGTAEATAFLSSLPHRYYEENNLHAFLIEQITDFDACVAALDAFLPCVDNWATCDSMNPKILGKHKDRLLSVIERWLDSKDTYAVRFGIKLLMTWFLDEDFEERYLARVARIRSEEYYVNMMIAWYFATALAKQYAATLPYLEEHRLPDWIHAKTVRKAIESYRISKEQKDHLRTL